MAFFGSLIERLLESSIVAENTDEDQEEVGRQYEAYKPNKVSTDFL